MNESFNDTIELSIWSLLDCGSRDLGQRFLEILLRFGFVPEKFGDEDPPKRKFSPSSTAEFMDVWETHPGQLVIEKRGGDGFQALVYLSINPHVVMPTYFVFYVRDQYFHRETPSKVLLFAEEMYGLFKPVMETLGTMRTEKPRRSFELPS